MNLRPVTIPRFSPSFNVNKYQNSYLRHSRSMSFVWQLSFFLDTCEASVGFFAVRTVPSPPLILSAIDRCHHVNWGNEVAKFLWHFPFLLLCIASLKIQKIELKRPPKFSFALWYVNIISFSRILYVRLSKRNLLQNPPKLDKLVSARYSLI